MQFYRTKEVYDKLLTKLGLQGLTLEEQVKKVREHPWRQFQEESRGGFEPTKNIKSQHRLKKRHYLTKLKDTKLRTDSEETPQVRTNKNEPTNEPLWEDYSKSQFTPENDEHAEILEDRKPKPKRKSKPRRS